MLSDHAPPADVWRSAVKVAVQTPSPRCS